jgi:hypothetical protein
MENPRRKRTGKMQAGSAVGADGAIAAGGELALGEGHGRGGFERGVIWPSCASKAAARSVLALVNASKLAAISVMDRAMAWLNAADVSGAGAGGRQPPQRAPVGRAPARWPQAGRPGR